MYDFREIYYECTRENIEKKSHNEKKNIVKLSQTSIWDKNVKITKSDQDSIID